MPSDRDRLIEILRNCIEENVGVNDPNVSFEVDYENIADYLLANGVIVQKQGEWIYKEFFGIEFPECSVCETQFEDANFEDYSYCPECGAKLKECEG